MNRQEEIQKVKGVQREFEAARLCIAEFLHTIHTNSDIPVFSDSDIRPSHIRNCGNNLEITYVIRLFAEFEATLRSYWAALRPSPRPRRTPAETVIDRIAAHEQMPPPVLRNAQVVREYRNSIVHDRLRTPRLTLYDCSSHLCRFLSHLPLH